MLAIDTSREKIIKNLAKVSSRLSALSLQKQPQIMAVIKYANDQDALAAIETGSIAVFAESRVQDALRRWNMPEFQKVRQKILLHFIGKLQSNKISKAAALFDSIDSIDSLKTALSLNLKCQEINKKMPVMIQLKINSADSQGGIEEKDFEFFFNEIKTLKNLSLRGIMAIGPNTDDEKDISAAFKRADTIYQKYFAKKTNEDGFLNHLSMGMSLDYHLAAAENATIIRLGSVLFENENGGNNDCES